MASSADDDEKKAIRALVLALRTLEPHEATLTRTDLQTFATFSRDALPMIPFFEGRLPILGILGALSDALKHQDATPQEHFETLLDCINRLPALDGNTPTRPWTDSGARALHAAAVEAIYAMVSHWRKEGKQNNRGQAEQMLVIVTSRTPKKYDANWLANTIARRARRAANQVATGVKSVGDAIADSTGMLNCFMPSIASNANNGNTNSDDSGN